MSGQPWLLDYPFPLARGGFAWLRLPADLSKDDADRLITLIATLVTEPLAGAASREKTSE